MKEGKITQMIMDSRVSFFKKKRYCVAFLFCLIVGAIYFYCAVCIKGNIFVPTGTDYYIYLLDAFFHGRINITPSGYDGLSLFENKWYIYWGFAPILLILPFYLIFHLQASDVLYTAIGGTLNVALFYYVMQEFKKYFRLSLSWMAEAFLVLSFGLASPNFFLSVAGQIYYTHQIFATTYLLLFYLLYFQFLNSEKHWQLVLCAVFFCLACLSRYTLVFNSILFLYAFLQSKRSGRAMPPKIILSVALLMLAFVGLEALYNFVRFHNVLETGYSFQVGLAGFNTKLPRKDPILSVRYFSENIYYYFINTVKFSNMKLIIDVAGNSIFSVYPALWLLPVLFCKRTYADKKRMSFLMIAGVVIGLNFLFLMFYAGTGGIDFGCRYFFDVIPLIFLLLMFILPSIPIFVQMGLLVYGLFINFSGSMAFYGLFPSFQETLFWIVLFTSIIPFASKERLEGI